MCKEEGLRRTILVGKNLTNRVPKRARGANRCPNLCPPHGKILATLMVVLHIGRRYGNRRRHVTAEKGSHQKLKDRCFITQDM